MCSTYVDLLSYFDSHIETAYTSMDVCKSIYCKARYTETKDQQQHNIDINFSNDLSKFMCDVWGNFFTITWNIKNLESA